MFFQGIFLYNLQIFEVGSQCVPAIKSLSA
jgi:hypothetical protein